LEDDVIRRRALLVVTMVASVLSAAPASAQEGWRWLEKLSGPGNFTGFEIGIKLLCEYKTVKEAPPSNRTLVGVSLPCVHKKPAKGQASSSDQSTKGDVGTGEDVRSIVSEDGTFYDLTQRKYALGVAVSYLRGASSLEYAKPESELDRTVQLWVFEGFYDRRLTDRLDYGVAAGANLFVTPEADSFTRFSVEPRLSLKLFDITKRRSNTYLGTVTLRLGIVAFFGEFLAEDFGAIPGTYRSGDSIEFGPSVRFILDLDRNPFK
jgi:hypothetical protein